MELGGQRCHAIALFRVGRVSCALDLQGDRCKRLPSFVVKGARDPKSFTLLGAQSGASADPPLLGQPIHHRIEGPGKRGEFGAFGFRHVDASAGIAQVDSLQFRRQILKRSQGATDQQQVDDQH